MLRKPDHDSKTWREIMCYDTPKCLDKIDIFTIKDASSGLKRLHADIANTSGDSRGSSPGKYGITIPKLATDLISTTFYITIFYLY